MTVRAVVLLVATTLAGCTTLANGTINRRLETRLRPGGAPILVIEDLERSLRQYAGADLVAIHTPLRGRRSQIELLGTPQAPCFAVRDHLILDDFSMIQGNPYKRMDVRLETSNGGIVTKHERRDVSDERMTVDYVVRGEGAVSSKILAVRATFCFSTPPELITRETKWIMFRAGVSRYTFHLR